MNQQRARRFCAAAERDRAKNLEAEVRAEMLKEGKGEVPSIPSKWDHNAITPGTPFMADLAAALKVLISK